jgi:hypothetical protein
MKKLALGLLATAALAAALAPLSANAATATSGFNVTVSLTSSCSITTPPSDVAFTYTSFGPAVTATPGAFAVRCTNSLPYGLSLDAAGGTVIGLAYTLSLSAATATGNGVAQSFSIGGGMIAGQSGTCSSTTTTPCTGTDNTRLLTITY